MKKVLIFALALSLVLTACERDYLIRSDVRVVYTDYTVDTISVVDADGMFFLENDVLYAGYRYAIATDVRAFEVIGPQMPVYRPSKYKYLD